MIKNVSNLSFSVVFNTAHTQYMGSNCYIYRYRIFSLPLHKKELVIDITIIDHFYMDDARLFLLALGIGAIIFKLNEWYNQRIDKMQENEESMRKFYREI